MLQVGDLVKCTWQPSGKWITKEKRVENMKFTIEGECGIIVKDEAGTRYQILFPKFNYTHILSTSAFEVISASR
jgi:hypothetical protein